MCVRERESCGTMCWRRQVPYSRNVHAVAVSKSTYNYRKQKCVRQIRRFLQVSMLSPYYLDSVWNLFAQTWILNLWDRNSFRSFRNGSKKIWNSFCFCFGTPRRGAEVASRGAATASKSCVVHIPSKYWLLNNEVAFEAIYCSHLGMISTEKLAFIAFIALSDAHYIRHLISRRLVFA